MVRSYEVIIFRTNTVIHSIFYRSVSDSHCHIQHCGCDAYSLPGDDHGPVLPDRCSASVECLSPLERLVSVQMTSVFRVVMDAQYDQSDYLSLLLY